MSQAQAAVNIYDPDSKDDQAVVFTESAAQKVYQLIEEEDNFDLKLRVFITGGGCSGLQYGFTFDEKPGFDDTIIKKSITAHESGKLADVELLIDSMSLQYLAGAEIDYKEDIEGAQFIIRNPNAQTTCGCGSSFTVDSGNDEF